MSLATRRSKINAIAQSAQEIPGSYKKSRYFSLNSVRDGKPYQVGWRYATEDGIVTLNTWLYSFEAKYHQFNHPANLNQSICYQVLGAIKAAAKKEGTIISFCDSFDKAVKLLNFGGRLLKIRNRGCGVVWAVVR